MATSGNDEQDKPALIELVGLEDCAFDPTVREQPCPAFTGDSSFEQALLRQLRDKDARLEEKESELVQRSILLREKNSQLCQRDAELQAAPRSKSTHCTPGYLGLIVDRHSKVVRRAVGHGRSSGEHTLTADFSGRKNQWFCFQAIFGTAEEGLLPSELAKAYRGKSSEVCRQTVHAMSDYLDSTLHVRVSDARRGDRRWRLEDSLTTNEPRDSSAT